MKCNHYIKGHLKRHFHIFVQVNYARPTLQAQAEIPAFLRGFTTLDHFGLKIKILKCADFVPEDLPVSEHFFFSKSGDIFSLVHY